MAWAQAKISAYYRIKRPIRHFLLSMLAISLILLPERPHSSGDPSQVLKSIILPPTPRCRYIFRLLGCAPLKFETDKDFGADKCHEPFLIEFFCIEPCFPFYPDQQLFGGGQTYAIAVAHLRPRSFGAFASLAFDFCSACHWAIQLAGHTTRRGDMAIGRGNVPSSIHS